MVSMGVSLAVFMGVSPVVSMLGVSCGLYGGCLQRSLWWVSLAVSMGVSPAVANTPFYIAVESLSNKKARLVEFVQ